MRGVVALGAHAAHDVGVVSEQREQARQIGRVVLAIGVEGRDHVAARRLEPGAERRGLSSVRAERDDPAARIARRLRKRPLQAAIAAAVVGEDQLPGRGHLIEHLLELGREAR